MHEGALGSIRQNSRNGSVNIAVSGTAILTVVSVAWRQWLQNSCGNVRSSAMDSGIQRLCRMGMLRRSSTCVTDECTATWSWRKKNASTTLLNVLELRSASCVLPARRLASSWEVVAMANWLLQQSTGWKGFTARLCEDTPTTWMSCEMLCGPVCTMQRRRTRGRSTTTARQTPGPHRTKVHTALSEEVAKPVREAYERLSHGDLLTRCLRGQTQNPNKGLHSKVWAKCPTTGFVCVHRVPSATCAAVAEFNVGVAATMRHLCEVVGVAQGQQLMASAEKTDASTSGTSDDSFGQESAMCSATCTTSWSPVNSTLCCPRHLIGHE